MKEITWHLSRHDYELIQMITDRAMSLLRRVGAKAKRMEIEMDLTAVHANGTRLRLEELFHADDFNFAHDVLGIRDHLNRQTGELMNCFVPRFAVPEIETEA